MESKNYPKYYFSPPTQTMLLIVALTAMPGKSMNSTALAGMITMFNTWQARSRCWSLGRHDRIDGDEFLPQLFVDLFNITSSSSSSSSYPWLARQRDVLLCLTLQWSHFQYRLGIGFWNWPGIFRLSLASQSLDWTSVHSSMLSSTFQPLITLAKMLASHDFWPDIFTFLTSCFRSPFYMHIS